MKLHLSPMEAQVRIVGSWQNMAHRTLGLSITYPIPKASPTQLVLGKHTQKSSPSPACTPKKSPTQLVLSKNKLNSSPSSERNSVVQ